MPGKRAPGITPRTIAFPDDLWAEVEDQATKYETTPSDVVRTAVRNLVDEEST